MNKCLYQICEGFEELKGFLKDPTENQKLLVTELFTEFIECFNALDSVTKLLYPREFSIDVNLYRERNPAVVDKFQDLSMQYLILSDFYDYVRIRKLYKSAKE